MNYKLQRKYWLKDLFTGLRISLGIVLVQPETEFLLTKNKLSFLLKSK